MELDECISKRRSVRSYNDLAVPKDIIKRILYAGVMAPSGMDLQPWHFTIIESREIINRLSKRTKEIVQRSVPLPEIMAAAFKSDRDVIFYGAPLVIMISVPKREDWRTVNLLDCGLAAENMMLTAYQEGLGSCFIGYASFLNQDQKMLSGVGIPDNHELMATLIFGSTSEVPATRQREAKVLNWFSQKS